MKTERKNRIRNALWGLFAGDALAMPAHWFYSLDNLRETFASGVTRYEAAPHPHPESFMVGMGYHPDVESAKRLGRPYNTLHEHIRFYDTSFSNLGIETGERESEHGNSTPKLEDRYHYHHGLGAGENTTGAQLARVLMRSVAQEGRYDEDAFLREFVAFMTTPGNLRDPYQEIYLRSWFENYSRGCPVHNAAERQRNVWSIGSHGGMIRPMVLSLLAETEYQALGFAIEHQNLTHRSENVAAALGVAVPLLQDLISGEDALEAALARSASLRVPKITGKEMFAMYREHKGPGNIPHRKMWELHVQLSDSSFDLREFAKQAPEEVVLEQLGTVCYPEHGLPLALYFAAHHEFDPEAALLGNTNAGGDNVHRNAVLGLMVGAASDDFPEHLKTGLAESEALSREIEAFVEVAAKGDVW
tara:strand:- start:1619 stop:2869 length:1251 start_codon:yes stop_codon:yes gene_type:complete